MTLNFKEFIDRGRERPYINDADRIQSGHEIKKEKISTRHHIKTRSSGGTDDENNIVPLYSDFHNALHRVFGNLEIREQIAQLMYLSAPALTRGFQKEIANIICEGDARYYYKDGIRCRR